MRCDCQLGEAFQPQDRRHRILQLPCNRQDFPKARFSGFQISMPEFRSALEAERLTREETVAQAARKRQHLFENRSSPVNIALLVYGDGEIAEVYCHEVIVAEGPRDLGA